MAKKKQTKTKTINKNSTLLILAACVAVCAVLVLGWMVFREVYQPGARDVSESKYNIVINTERAPASLVSALLSEDAGCDGLNPANKNINYIVRANDTFALVHYGCAFDAYMFYKKAGDTWKGVSPTNQFVDSIPLCSHLKDNGIPASFQAFCYDTPGTESGAQPKLVANPVS